MRTRFLVLFCAASLMAVAGCDNSTTTDEDGGASVDAFVSRADTGPSMPDAGPRDAGPGLGDAGPGDAGAKPTDGGPMSDGGMVKPDGGMMMMSDGGPLADGGPGMDGGPLADGGPRVDGGPLADGGPRVDGGACGATNLGSVLGDSVAMGTTVGAPDSYMRTCAVAGPGADRAFLWTAPSAGDFLIDTNGSAYDTALVLYSACTGGTALACDDDGGTGADSRIARTFAMGETVLIVVDGFNGATGAFVLSINAGPATETMCFDTIDNDRDGQIDCTDFDCDAEPACHELDCTNGMDDDMDGATDCDDFDCDGDPACTELNCTNGMDDDMDGFIDCADFDCDGDPACSETDCADGVDDDGDFAIDCDDFDCFGDAACGESMCMNSVDDDMDGRTDCADSECTCDAACITPTCPDMDLVMMTGASVITGTMPPRCSEYAGLCGGAGPEIMFRWVAPSAGSYTVTTIGSTFDTVLHVLRGGCGGTETACNDDAGGSLQSSVTFTATTGEVFVIALDSYGSRVGDYVLNITGP